MSTPPHLNWPRWIFASASKHFQDAAGAYPIHMFIEGVDRLTHEETKWIEFRMTGPQTTQLNKNYFRLDVEINILWSVDIDATDFHEPYRVSGMLVAAMSDICIYKYDDGDALLGTLQLTQDKNNSVRANNFGQIRSDTKIVQGTVEGLYRMYLLV